MSQSYIRAELRGEVVLSSACAILVGVAYFFLPDPLRLVPNWTVFAIAILFVLPLFYSVFIRSLPHHIPRYFRFALQALLATALVTSVIRLVQFLPAISKGGQSLLLPAGLLWLSNILIFAQWYWEIDGGGPLARTRKFGVAGDFLFPQHANGEKWTPGFIDYLFLAFCFSTALSPADTVPLTQRAKLFMMGQALISLLLIAMVISRAINILGG